MRVISGEARGRRLITLEDMDVRPTTDKVKESIFNIIQFDIEGSNVLDLFSGSGQLGIEALSRGAKHCTFIDQSKRSLDITKKNIAACSFEQRSGVYKEDALDFLEKTHEIFDIALLDPPYRQGLIRKALPELTKKMSKNGIIICELSAEEDLTQTVNDFSISREYKYGKIKILVYKRNN